MPENTHRIFFSYARSDASFVLRVANALRKAGLPVWVDQLDIPKGTRWDDEVEKALKASSCLLVVLSPASAQSQNVMDEVAFALDENRTVLPILLLAGSIPFRLKRLQYIDFTGDFDAAYLELVAALHALSPQPTAQAADDSLPAPVKEPAAASAQVRPAKTAPPGQPEPVALTAPPAAAAPKGFPTGIVVAAAAVLVLGGAYLLFGPHGTTPVEPTPPREAAGPERRETPAQPPPRQAQDALVPPPDAARPPATADTASLGDVRVKAFVMDYIAAQNRANAAELLQFYADKVDYFDQIGVGKDFILKDKQGYYRRWPEVENRLTSEVGIERSQGERTVRVSYTIRYRVNNPSRAETRTGMARDTLLLHVVNGEPAIVSQRQQGLGGAGN
jgi:TIR domain